MSAIMGQDQVLIAGVGLSGLLTALPLAPLPVTLGSPGATGTRSSSA